MMIPRWPGVSLAESIPRDGAVRRRLRRAIGRVSLLAACSLAPAAFASTEQAASPKAAMTPLADEELSQVRGADGINLNLSNFSFTSSTDNPFSLTYASPNGGTLTLSRIDLSRTDDTDAFADPYSLTVLANGTLPNIISLAFPANPVGTGNQFWTMAADFLNCDQGTSTSCSGTDFDVGTIKISQLAFHGGGLTIAPSTVANTQGIAFGMSLALDIGSLAIYSRGRNAADHPDTSDSLIFSGIHLSQANTPSTPWTLADINLQPGLFNADTDATSSYLHFQIGWPTTSAPVPAATLSISDISFSNTPPAGGAPVQTSLGSSSIASIQINYMDVRLRAGK